MGRQIAVIYETTDAKPAAAQVPLEQPQEPPKARVDVDDRKPANFLELLLAGGELDHAPVDFTLPTFEVAAAHAENPYPDFSSLALDLPNDPNLSPYDLPVLPGSFLRDHFVAVMLGSIGTGASARHAPVATMTAEELLDFRDHWQFNRNLQLGGRGTSSPVQFMMDFKDSLFYPDDAVHKPLENARIAGDFARLIGERGIYYVQNTRDGKELKTQWLPIYAHPPHIARTTTPWMNPVMYETDASGSFITRGGKKVPKLVPECFLYAHSYFLPLTGEMVEDQAYRNIVRAMWEITILCTQSTIDRDKKGSYREYFDMKRGIKRRNAILYPSTMWLGVVDLHGTGSPVAMAFARNERTGEMKSMPADWNAVALMAHSITTWHPNDILDHRAGKDHHAENARQMSTAASKSYLPLSKEYGSFFLESRKPMLDTPPSIPHEPITIPGLEAFPIDPADLYEHLLRGHMAGDKPMDPKLAEVLVNDIFYNAEILNSSEMNDIIALVKLCSNYAFNEVKRFNREQNDVFLESGLADPSIEEANEVGRLLRYRNAHSFDASLVGYGEPVLQVEYAMRFIELFTQALDKKKVAFGADRNVSFTTAFYDVLHYMFRQGAMPVDRRALMCEMLLMYVSIAQARNLFPKLMAQDEQYGTDGVDLRDFYTHYVDPITRVFETEDDQRARFDPPAQMREDREVMAQRITKNLNGFVQGALKLHEIVPFNAEGTDILGDQGHFMTLDGLRTPSVRTLEAMTKVFYGAAIVVVAVTAVAAIGSQIASKRTDEGKVHITWDQSTIQKAKEYYGGLAATAAAVDQPQAAPVQEQRAGNMSTMNQEKRMYTNNASFTPGARAVHVLHEAKDSAMPAWNFLREGMTTDLLRQGRYLILADITDNGTSGLAQIGTADVPSMTTITATRGYPAIVMENLSSASVQGDHNPKFEAFVDTLVNSGIIDIDTGEKIKRGNYTGFIDTIVQQGDEFFLIGDNGNKVKISIDEKFARAMKEKKADILMIGIGN